MNDARTKWRRYWTDLSGIDDDFEQEHALAAN